MTFDGCKDIHEAMSAYLDEELDVEARGRFEAHVAECAECQEELKSMKQVDAAYAGLPAPHAPENFAETAVAVAEGEAEAAADTVREFARTPPVWMGPLVAVAAAGFVVAIGVFFLERGQEQRMQVAEVAEESAVEDTLEVRPPENPPEAFRASPDTTATSARTDRAPETTESDGAWEGFVDDASEGAAPPQRERAAASRPEGVEQEARKSATTFESFIGQGARTEDALDDATPNAANDRVEVLGEPPASPSAAEPEPGAPILDEDTEQQIRESAPLGSVKLRSFRVGGDGVWYERGYDGEDTTPLPRNSGRLRELMKTHPEDDWDQLFRRNAPQIIEVDGEWYELLPPPDSEGPEGEDAAN